MKDEPMKMARVYVGLEYIVEFGDQNMIDTAVDCIIEDICNAVKSDEVDYLIKIVEAPEATEHDISDFLLDEEGLGHGDDEEEDVDGTNSN